jgi:hypothetical protein
MSGLVLPPVPDYELTEPSLGQSLGQTTSPSLVPPLELPSATGAPPSLTTPLPGIGPQLPPNLLSPAEGGGSFGVPWLGLPDIGGGGAAGGGNPLGFLNDFVENMSSGPGLQIDKHGAGTTLGDWALRFMPYVPYLNPGP